MSLPENCFHCALPIPSDCDLTIEVDGAGKPVCCPGCQAVATLILGSGMESYYDMRDAPEPGVGRPDASDDEWRVFDREDMLAAFAEQHGDSATVNVYVAGMYCSACSWLIETSLGRTDGIGSAEVNPVTHRVRISFQPAKIGFGRVLALLANLGYKPQPLTPESTERPELIEQRTALKRLLVASLGMMQAMMFAVALYAGDYQGIDEGMQGFLRIVSFIVTTPVVFYSARPFFAGAIRGLRARQPGMDLPVSIAVGSAYAASVYSTLTGGEAVWYDSVSMFVFFLTLGRFLEMRARHRAVDRTVALTSILPNTVTLLEGGERSVVPVSSLVAGNRIVVGPGESIPADGRLIAGDTSVDESLLTGESEAVARGPGDVVVAGSVNRDASIEIEVSKTGIDTTLGAISRMSERARYARPAFVRLADRIASYVVVALLAVAAVVATAWYLLEPDRAFVVTLSVLVVTCPCALALATPAAFAAAGSRLSDLRLLITQGEAIEAISRANRFVFDKTGTLTYGRPVVTDCRVLDDSLTERDAMRVAAALEADSTHPLAQAFPANGDSTVATECRAVAGLGVAGDVKGQSWRLGKREFVESRADSESSHATRVWLGRDGRAVAVFEIADQLRADAADTVSRLRAAGAKVTLLSGDAEGPVEQVARQLAIDDMHASCTPQDKLDVIRRFQADGDTVVMVGDGINDAPVLAAADASIAPAHAASLAQTSADVIMLGEHLAPVVTIVRIARQTMRIVRQNLGWAIVYNAGALPLAAMGLVPPWLAAIGMSASSLIVVLNALRLSRYD